MSTNSTSLKSSTGKPDAYADERMSEGDACDLSQIVTTTTTNDVPHSIDSQDFTHEEISSADDASSKYIVERLKEIYHTHVLKAEKRYHLHYNFGLPTDGELKDSEFDAAPMVLLIGQYSTGKTTFINHLLREGFPGMHIGPEPTTDKFMALYYGGDDLNGSDDNVLNSGLHQSNIDDDASDSGVTDYIETSGRLVKGNTLTITPNLPFSSLSQFGSAFLNHFVGSSSSSPLLKRLTFIDSPGVLSGQKQRSNRPYDFGQVTKWFADRSDLILLLFDAHKLDISDELQNVIDTIRLYNDDKIRCVLNKADSVTREQMVRVYGALMWSMGKIFNTPEVVRVYTGSYWNGALVNDDFQHMFEKDEKSLVRELLDLPRCAAERKINQMVNRIRLVKVHVCILGTLRQISPLWFRKERSRENILKDLVSIMDNVRVKFDLSKGDMPDPQAFAQCLKKFPDFRVFPSIDRALIDRLDSLITHDIPEIVRDADIVANEVRLGQRTVIQKQIPTEKDRSGKEMKPENVPYVRGFVVKVLAFVFLLVCIFEVVYFWAYSRPTYSPRELHTGLTAYIKNSGTSSESSLGNEL